MAPRANWKGYLRLSLVSCPIAVPERESQFQSTQSKDRQPIEAAKCRFRNGRGGAQGGYSAGV